MERMSQDTMRAALIYQHTTRDADRRIADALGGPAGASSDATVTPLSARGVHDPESARPAGLA